MTDPRYPIGDFSFDTKVSAADVPELIAQMERLPGEMRIACAGLQPADLARTYRPGAWTIQQLVHHVADSHMNGFVRWKLALTENAPTICPYDEVSWAKLADVALPIEHSLSMLDAIHARWGAVLHALGPKDLERTYVHPQHGRAMRLDLSLANYAWHGRHHTAHIRVARGMAIAQ